MDWAQRSECLAAKRIKFACIGQTVALCRWCYAFRDLDLAPGGTVLILTFFVHRLTNGPIEGLNNKIQGLIKKAFGYRNKERFKTDIFFHLGGLDLYPAQ